MANQNDGGYASERSAFGGLMLSTISGVQDTARTALADYGITDAEQVLALAALPDVRPNLEKALGKTDLDKLLAELRSNVGDMAAAAAEAPVPGTLGLGAMEPSPEMVAEMQSMMVAGPGDAVALPGNINHALSMSPIRNQGSRGTCVAFAMTAMHEFYRTKTGFPNDFSEQWLYHRTKAIDGSAGCGTWAVKAAQILSNEEKSEE